MRKPPADLPVETDTLVCPKCGWRGRRCNLLTGSGPYGTHPYCPQCSYEYSEEWKAEPHVMTSQKMADPFATAKAERRFWERIFLAFAGMRADAAKKADEAVAEWRKRFSTPEA